MLCKYEFECNKYVQHYVKHYLQLVALWAEVSICPYQISRSYKQASQGFPAHCARLTPVWWGCTRLLSSSFLHSFPSPPPFVLSISEGLSPWGKEGVIWSLRALIKTSVWLSGISCADVCVSVYFSVALWLHDNLSSFLAFSLLHCLCVSLSLSDSLCLCFSQGIDEASSKDKWVFWPQFLLLRQLLLFVVDWQDVTLEPTVVFIKSDPTHH